MLQPIGPMVGMIGAPRRQIHYRLRHDRVAAGEEPREHPTIIKKEHRLRSDKKVIIYDDD